MMNFYENFDIECINIKPKKDKRSKLTKYKNLYYWILHQSLTDNAIGKSDTIKFDYNGENINWAPFVSSLDSLRILGILRPVLKARNSSKDAKWIGLSKTLISQVSNLLFIERNDKSHIVKCISIIARFSSYSLSNGCFDSTLLSLDSDIFTSLIDIAHIIKGYVKAKRFEPLLYLKLLSHIEHSNSSAADKNTAIAISLNAISEYWWYWKEIKFDINDLIHPKDAVSITNVIGKFEISDKLKYKFTELSSIFILKIIENPSIYNSKDLSQVCKSLTYIALINPRNEQLIQIMGKILSLNILSGPLLIDILSSHILAGIVPPIDLVVKCIIQLRHSKLSGDDISKLKLITHISGFSALGFRRTFRKVLSSIHCTSTLNVESHLITHYLGGNTSKFSIPSDFKIVDIKSITKFQVLSNVSIT